MDLKRLKKVYIDTYKEVWKTIKPFLLIVGIVMYGSIGGMFILLDNMGANKEIQIDFFLIGVFLILPAVVFMGIFLSLIGKK